MIGMFDYGQRHKPDFRELEWRLPSEEFMKIGLRKSTLTSDTDFVMKSVFDTLISFGILLVSIPFFIIISLFVKTTKGPVFFTQERIGMDGKKFKMYKFRSMLSDAEQTKKALFKLNEASGPVFKIRRDPRITKVGRFLRKTGLDELPQMINVIKGDMSLIGPRPPIESEVEQYDKWHTRRLAVKPGITCSWQISKNRHDISFDEWVQMDLDYIDNWTFMKDIKIFAKTIKTVFVATGH